MIRIAVLAAAVLTGSPAVRAQEADHSHDEKPAQHVAEVGNLHLIHAWTRATEAGEALVFLEIANNGSKVALLTGGESAIAAEVEVVGFQLQDGHGTYVDLQDLPIAPGSKMTLAPDGVALRLTGLAQPLHEGAVFAMEIQFESVHAEVTVAIEAAGAMQHSHAGHDD